MKNNKKKVLLVLAVAIFVLAMSTTGLAASLKRNFAVTYRNIRVVYNGSQANLANEPFIVDEQGRTYLALNDMALLFDKNISWNDATSTISIEDKPGQGNAVEMYNMQLEITRLQNENKKLKEQAEEKDKVVDLDDLEDDLNDAYEKEFKSDGLYLEITLKGDEDDVSVAIEALDKDDDRVDNVFSYVSESELEDLLEDIYDDITKEYKDAEVDGYVRDSSGKIEFDFDRKGNVDLDY
ncbi:MAG: hypothetical protein PHY91_03435 [Tissierellia bacterium]|nr:hypothetical protein [Tissierellia bacterium]